MCNPWRMDCSMEGVNCWEDRAGEHVFGRVVGQPCSRHFSFQWSLLSRSQKPSYFFQHQESRPLGRSNTGSPRSTDFPSLWASSEWNLANLIGREYKPITLRMLRKLDNPRGRDSWFWKKGAQDEITLTTFVTIPPQYFLSVLPCTWRHHFSKKLKLLR